MKVTTVVSLKGKKPLWGASLEKAPEDVVYIGRKMTMGGWNLPGSKFANPFKTGKRDQRVATNTLEEVCNEYRRYILEKPDLQEALSELKGKTLACWCSPEACHGDILRELIEGHLPGEVYVDHLPNRQDRKAGKGKWPIKKASDGVVCINCNCSSGNRGLWKELSPFFVKPDPFVETMPYRKKKVKRQATCIENLWQATKVESRYLRIKKDKPPPEAWWKRRNRVWTDLKPHRHVIPKEDRINPNRAYSYWNGEYYPYCDARRIIYILHYAHAVAKTEAYKKLQDIVRRGHHVQILGPDGRSFSDLKTELRDDTKPFGHELVLAAMLRNERVWLNPKGYLLNNQGYVIALFE